MSDRVQTSSLPREYVTFHVGDLLVGIDVQIVQEINRLQCGVTPVPRAPEHIRGVLHLRGEVVTVLDLRRLLGLPPSELTRHSRNVVVDHDGERFALVVDRIADVESCSPDQIEQPPGNVRGVDERCFIGVLQVERGIVALLDIATLIGSQGVGV
ncbi:MAG: purine-binding chemotaxis protein CheW [Planctomycetes bacterium]|nr:purine-binding chemotaxis protein CheW [Planctomycetota bacterium]